MKDSAKIFMFVCIGILTLSFGVRTEAEPIQWRVEDGGNGHWYEWIQTDYSWTVAYAVTLGMTYLEMPGHLVTLTSPEESTYVKAMLPEYTDGPFRVWIGLFQHPGSSEPDGGWAWVTGELLEYDDWAPNEPNDMGNEDFCELYTNGGDAVFRWNDLGDHEFTSSGFIVECGGGYISANDASLSAIKALY